MLSMGKVSGVQGRSPGGGWGAEPPIRKNSTKLTALLSLSARVPGHYSMGVVKLVASNI